MLYTIQRQCNMAKNDRLVCFESITQPSAFTFHAYLHIIQYTMFQGQQTKPETRK